MPSSPTVVFPNPEEKGALDNAIAFSDEKGCDLILANDPDADRCLAVAERLPAGEGEDGRSCLSGGNQIGQLLGYWQMMPAEGEGKQLRGGSPHHSGQPPACCRLSPPPREWATLTRSQASNGSGIVPWSLERTGQRSVAKL